MAAISALGECIAGRERMGGSSLLRGSRHHQQQHHHHHHLSSRANKAQNITFSLHPSDHLKPLCFKKQKQDRRYTKREQDSGTIKSGKIGQEILRYLEVELENEMEDEDGSAIDIEDMIDVVRAEPSILDAVVKVFCKCVDPDYALPWQMQRQYMTFGSGFLIPGRRLLTNAHCIKHYTQVKVRKTGDDTKYIAEVLSIGAECDIALLSIDSEEFWKDTEPLQLGELPQLQDAVTVVGFPIGGDTVSVTRGVVSRIEVVPYSLGGFELLAVQIDAAVNPGNSGGPAFNDAGECVGIAFQAYAEGENISYVIPTTVISHFLEDYERNGKYTGFPSLGVRFQNMENPVLRAWLKMRPDQKVDHKIWIPQKGILVRQIEPTSPSKDCLKEGDVILSFDGTPVSNEATVPFRPGERIAFGHLVSQKFTGDHAELQILRNGEELKIDMVLKPSVRLVPHLIDQRQPSYFIIAGLVFTPISEPLLEDQFTFDEDSMGFGLQIAAKARYHMAEFDGEELIILTQVLAHTCNIGYEDMSAIQVLKFNGIKLRNLQHLASLVDYISFHAIERESEEANVIMRERAEFVSQVQEKLREGYAKVEGRVNKKRKEKVFKE